MKWTVGDGVGSSPDYVKSLFLTVPSLLAKVRVPTDFFLLLMTLLNTRCQEKTVSLGGDSR